MSSVGSYNCRDAHGCFSGEHLLRYLRALPTIRVHLKLDGRTLDIVHSLILLLSRLMNPPLPPPPHTHTPSFSPCHGKKPNARKLRVQCVHMSETTMKVGSKS